MAILEQVPGREFAIMLSRRCNLTCRHCGIESSPQVRDRMPREDAERFIVEAAGLEDFRKVTFTGGEPTLLAADLEYLIGLCTSLGLATRIVTNGHWASTHQRGMRFLGKLKDAGLSELNFSADRFHLEFMPAERLRTALDCSRELGYARIVSFVSNADRHPFDEFSDLYGIDSEQLIDLRPALEKGVSLSALKDDHIFLFYGGLIGLGRAAMYPADLRFFPLDYFPTDQGCGEVVNKPVIYPDGSFQACCCAGGKIEAFTVGNAYEEDIASLYDRMCARSHFQLINAYGPRQLHECIKAARPDLKFPMQYTSICEMCVRSTERVPAAEVDQIAEQWMLRRFLTDIGGHPDPAEDAALNAP